MSDECGWGRAVEVPPPSIWGGSAKFLEGGFQGLAADRQVEGAVGDGERPVDAALQVLHRLIDELLGDRQDRDVAGPGEF